MTIIGAFLIIFGISVIIFPELIAIIIGIEKFGLLNFGANSGSPQLATEGDDDDDF